MNNFLKKLRSFFNMAPRSEWTFLNHNPNAAPAPERLYVVVRNDLIPGLQISQSIHAKDEFTHAFPETEMEWRKNSNTIIILSGSRYELAKLRNMAEVWHIKHSVFEEPDLNNEVTAIALEPGLLTVSIVSELPLALKDLI